MHNLVAAKESMLKALELDVASTRLPALLEEGAMIAFSGLFFVCWYGRIGFLGSTTRSEHTDG